MRPIFGAWEANDIAMWRCVVRWLRRPILVVSLDRFRFAAIAALFALLLGPRMHGINFARRSLGFSFEMWVYRGTEISTPLAKNHFCWHLRDHHMPMVAIRFLA